MIDESIQMTNEWKSLDWRW